jgi:hypothetical protein
VNSSPNGAAVDSHTTACTSVNTPLPSLLLSLLPSPPVPPSKRPSLEFVAAHSAAPQNLHAPRSGFTVPSPHCAHHFTSAAFLRPRPKKVRFS